MKIVIDIPEKYLNTSSGIIDATLFTDKNNTITDVNIEDTYAKFQVLPKGHGDLVDKDTITVEEDVYFQNYIIHAPTIIPADKGE